MAGKELLSGKGLCYGADKDGVVVLKKPVPTRISVQSDLPLQITEFECPCYDKHSGLCNAFLQKKNASEDDRGTCVYFASENPARPLFVFNEEPEAILGDANLTQKQLDVLTLAAEGLDHDDIAYELDRPISTTRQQLAACYKKLGKIGIHNQTDSVIAFGLRTEVDEKTQAKLKKKRNTLLKSEKRALDVTIYEARTTQEDLAKRLGKKWQTVRTHYGLARNKYDVNTTRTALRKHVAAESKE